MKRKVRKLLVFGRHLDVSDVLVIAAFGALGCGGPGEQSVPTEPVDERLCLHDAPFPEPEIGELPSGCDDTSTPAVNVADNGCVTSSDPGREGSASPVRVFDDNSGTNWITDNPAPWIAYEFAGTDTHTVVSYRVTVAGDGESRDADPASWEFQASNDGPDIEHPSWTTLDVRQHEGFDGRYHAHVFSFENDAAFHRYRFSVRENGGAAMFKLAEVELFHEGSPLFSIDNADLDESDNYFAFSTGWSLSTDHTSERYHGSSSWSAELGEEATVFFVGSQVRLYGVLDPHHGIASVSIDGDREEPVDLYGPTTEYNRLIYTSPRLCPGPHALRIVVTGNKNPASTDVFVSLDRAEVVP
jgi:hypothetical protein